MEGGSTVKKDAKKLIRHKNSEKEGHKKTRRTPEKIRNDKKDTKIINSDDTNTSRITKTSDLNKRHK